jgi:hypothetical protein
MAKFSACFGCPNLLDAARLSEELLDAVEFSTAAGASGKGGRGKCVLQIDSNCH